MEYKLIINLGLENEKIIYFKNYTRKILNLINNNNYILLEFNDYFNKWVYFDYKLSEYQKRLFNNNINKYC